MDKHRITEGSDWQGCDNCVYASNHNREYCRCNLPSATERMDYWLVMRRSDWCDCWERDK